MAKQTRKANAWYFLNSSTFRFPTSQKYEPYSVQNVQRIKENEGALLPSGHALYNVKQLLAQEVESRRFKAAASGQDPQHVMDLLQAKNDELSFYVSKGCRSGDRSERNDSSCFVDARMPITWNQPPVRGLGNRASTSSAVRR